MLKKEDSNKQIWVSTIFLCAFGLVMIYSASAYECSISAKYNYDSMYLFKRQLAFVILGLICCFVFQHLNYAILYRFTKYIYAIGIGLIFLLKSGLGVNVNGATRWIT